MIDFEITRMDQGTCRCFDRERAGIDDRVCHMHPLNFEITDLILLTLGDETKIACVIFQAMFVELVFDHRQRQWRSVDREF